MKGVTCLSLTLMCGFMVSAAANAGCGEMQAQCIVFEHGETTPVSCSISVCANTSEFDTYWTLSNGSEISHHINANTATIKVNGQTGFALPSAIIQDNLSCYSAPGISSIYCAKDMLL
ncbi:hypothetical protein KCG43_13820 [Photobacterium sp. WH24]|uniref:hypothetical protein n=1 Tax=Photobacterium sp. WH24 TaxID=2827237 RepID=UPI001C44BF1B|nr:hypothetical protein [Photobacterium sp. WH24]MBV7263078.1 hypothetical protein [Photobacterium sp. WH24]